MAITSIHSIKHTVNKAINYIIKDKVIEHDGHPVLYPTIAIGINCNITTAPQAWRNIRYMHGKNSGNLAYHVIQNFGAEIDPAIANEIGVRLAKELFGEYQCIVSTHTNPPYTHNHIMFNSVAIADGKKYHDCLKSVYDIRKVSDRLCQEYGLPVLEETSEFRPIKYKDQSGKVRFYEPTERKNLIREGEFSNANDYRNTAAYKNSVYLKTANYDVIKKDIDTLLPYATSYEDLLDKLKDIGYEIKAKTKSGDWRMHISFKAPLQLKATRDDTLGPEYTRESLTAIIEENTKKTADRETQQPEPFAVQYTDRYQYGRTDINKMNPEYRIIKTNQTYRQVERSEIEKYIINDTKDLNKKIDIEIRSAWSSKHQPDQAEENKYTQYLVNRINGNLKTLQFVEDKNLKSFQQIYDTIQLLYNKRNMAFAELSKISSLLKKANAALAMINKYDDLKLKISQEIDDPDYIQYELDNDKELLGSFESYLKQLNLLESDQQLQFKDKVFKYDTSLRQLSSAFKNINEQIREYDNCIYHINLIDKSSRQQYHNEIEQYYSLKKESRYQNQKSDKKER